MPDTTLLDIPQAEQDQMLAALRRARYGYLMESKDGVHVASRQWNSVQRSPHRTSSFHHIRRSNSGCLRIFALYVDLSLPTAYCCPLGFPMPGISRPLCPVSGSPGLPGWA
jgi:hypothetical protein